MPIRTVNKGAVPGASLDKGLPLMHAPGVRCYRVFMSGTGAFSFLNDPHQGNGQLKEHVALSRIIVRQIEAPRAARGAGAGVGALQVSVAASSVAAAS